MKTDLTKFLFFYNFTRRHGSLRREINVKTPYDAILKWYELKPEIFKINPEEFKKNNINLDLT